MDNTQVIILCAGQQGRFESPTLKQLVEFHGQPLLSRTIAQCNLKDAVPYIVTVHNQIKAECENHLCYTYEPYDNSKTVTTFHSTKELWQPRTIILLGDVYYSTDAINTIFSNTQKLAVFGNRMEIFAVSFIPHPRISKCLNIAANTKRGKIWEFYRAYCNIPTDQHKFDNQGVYIDIRDETNDIDTLAEYAKQKRLVE